MCQVCDLGVFTQNDALSGLEYAGKPEDIAPRPPGSSVGSRGCVAGDLASALSIAAVVVFLAFRITTETVPWVEASNPRV